HGRPTPSARPAARRTGPQRPGLAAHPAAHGPLMRFVKSPESHNALAMNISVPQLSLRPIALVGLAIAVLSGACTRDPPAPPVSRAGTRAPPAPPVSYSRAHPAEQNEVMQRCHDDPGGAGRPPLCVNAAEAARLRDIGSLRDLPPLGLPGARSPNNPGELDHD